MKIWIGGEIDGAVDEVFREARSPLQRLLAERLANEDYGPALTDIGFTPILLGGAFDGLYPERRLFQRKQAACDYRIELDYVAFRDGTVATRQALLLRGLVETIEDVSRKAQKGFDAPRLVANILAATGHTRESLGVPPPGPHRRRTA